MRRRARARRRSVAHRSARGARADATGGRSARDPPAARRSPPGSRAVAARIRWAKRWARRLVHRVFGRLCERTCVSSESEYNKLLYIACSHLILVAVQRIVGWGRVHTAGRDSELQAVPMRAGRSLLHISGSHLDSEDMRWVAIY